MLFFKFLRAEDRKKFQWGTEEGFWVGVFAVAVRRIDGESWV